MKTNAMKIAVSHHEIQQAQLAYIRGHGYQASILESGDLTVQDPVLRSGHGEKAGLLILDGFTPVAIRTNLDALRFVMDRS
jgi:hypothetical protein